LDFILKANHVFSLKFYRKKRIFFLHIMQVMLLFYHELLLFLMIGLVVVCGIDARNKVNLVGFINYGEDLHSLNGDNLDWVQSHFKIWTLYVPLPPHNHSPNLKKIHAFLIYQIHHNECLINDKPCWTLPYGLKTREEHKTEAWDWGYLELLKYTYTLVFFALQT